MVKNSELVKMKTLHLSLNDSKSPSGFTCPEGPEVIVHASQKTQNKLKNHKILKKSVLLLFAQDFRVYLHRVLQNHRC